MEYVTEINIVNHVESIVESFDLVNQAKALVSNNTCVVAMLTEPIYSSKLKKELIDSIKDKINAEYKFDNIYVVLDIDIYYKILSNDGNKNSEILKLVRERNR